jgi:hypothetical protein
VMGMTGEPFYCFSAILLNGLDITYVVSVEGR